MLIAIGYYFTILMYVEYGKNPYFQQPQKSSNITNRNCQLWQIKCSLDVKVLSTLVREAFFIQIGCATTRVRFTKAPMSDFQLKSN